EHCGQRAELLSLCEVQVAVADPGRRRSDQNLVRVGLVDVDMLDRQRGPDLAEHGGLHLEVPLAAGGGDHMVRQVVSGRYPNPMCGVAGMIAMSARHGGPEPALTAAMADVLTHRGPD